MTEKDLEDGRLSVLRCALMKWGKQIRLAFVYGSMARGDDKPGSDIDLMVIGDVDLEDVLARLSDLEISLGRSIDLTAYTLAEFRSKLASGNHFLNAVVRREKVFLIGDEEQLREIAVKRLFDGGG